MGENEKNANSGGYRARRGIANALFVISLLIYLAVTVICALAFSSSKGAEGAEAIGLIFIVALYFEIGTAVYAAVAVFNVIALLLVNINKPERGFKGIAYMLLAVAAIATYFIFIACI